MPFLSLSFFLEIGGQKTQNQCQNESTGRVSLTWPPCRSVHQRRTRLINTCAAVKQPLSLFCRVKPNKHGHWQTHSHTHKQKTLATQKLPASRLVSGGKSANLASGHGLETVHRRVCPVACDQWKQCITSGQDTSITVCYCSITPVGIVSTWSAVCAHYVCTLTYSCSSNQPIITYIGE